MSVWKPEVPYNDLPRVPDTNHLETRAVLKAAIGARAAIATLDEAARSMPNPAVLINTIPLLEAQASSEIENVVTTTDALFRHVDNVEGADAATRETLRYRTALRIGTELAESRGITANTAAAVCSAIHGTEMSVRTLPGTRIATPGTRQIVYSPPEGRPVIESKLTDWERFVHADDDLDPLVRMAAAHYQFEAIHPFSDGNGRTGRILNVLMLVRAGLLHLPLLYLSRYIIDTKDEYYSRLLAVTATGAWEEWLVYVLRGVEATSDRTARRIGEIHELQNHFAQAARSLWHGGVDVELLAVLFEQPYCRIANVVERCGVSRPTATARLQALSEAGLLSEARVGRERLFINHHFLSLLAS